MADIDIFSLEPHQVSRDLRGYITFFYGDAKSGKTTIASKFEKPLLLAFEKGFNALPGVKAQPVNSWAEFRKVLRQLKDPRAHDIYSTIIVDTADLAYDYCEKYICANAPRTKEQGGGFGVDTVSDIPFGKGYGMVAKEFDECLRLITQLDFGLVMISHAVDKTFTDENGQEYNQIVPTLDKRARNIVVRMADIVGYSRAIMDNTGNLSTKLFMRGTPRYIAGSRFRYMPAVIDFNYKSLVNAMHEAIDKEAAEVGEEYYKTEKNNLYIDTTQDLNFDDLMSEFNDIVEKIQKSSSEDEFATNWAPKIGQITDKYLGKGNKVFNCSRDQTEALSLIVDDMRILCQQLPKQ